MSWTGSATAPAASGGRFLYGVYNQLMEVGKIRMAVRFGGGVTLPKEREYLFIDGGCLRSSVRMICREIFGDGQAYQPFVPGLVGQFDKVFYYDAVSGKDRGETQAAYEARVQPEFDRIEKIQALDRVHVALGRIVGTDRRQKGVDVKLAVDMMTQAFRGNTSRVTLLAGDADFEPLVRSLVGEGIDVTLWHPPQANADLKGAADITRLFSFRGNHNCLSLDGREQAFREQRSGSSMQGPDDARTVSIGRYQFAGWWEKGCLSVWRNQLPTHFWEFFEFCAPGSTLRNALRAFDFMHAWDIASSGEEWIETR